VPGGQSANDLDVGNWTTANRFRADHKDCISNGNVRDAPVMPIPSPDPVGRAMAGYFVVIAACTWFGPTPKKSVAAVVHDEVDPIVNPGRFVTPLT
jgi:hypothetical protein